MRTLMALRCLLTIPIRVRRSHPDASPSRRRPDSAFVRAKDKIPPGSPEFVSSRAPCGIRADDCKWSFINRVDRGTTISEPRFVGHESNIEVRQLALDHRDGPLAFSQARGKRVVRKRLNFAGTIPWTGTGWSR